MKRQALLCRLSCLAFIMTLGWPSSASAQSDAQRDAAQHYEIATNLLDEGDYQGAAREFRKAYELSKNPTALFALGQAYAMALDPVRAVDAYDQYLHLPVKRDPGTEREAQAKFGEQSKRIAYLTVHAKPASAAVTLTVDQVEVPVSVEQRVAMGARSVKVAASGYEPMTITVELVSLERRSVEIQLKPAPLAPPPQPPQPPQAPLLVRCNVLDVSVALDGSEIGSTPLAATLVAVGPHVLDFRRPGYRPVSVRANVPGHASECGIEPLSPVPAPFAARLEVRSSEPDAEIRLDGTRIQHRAVIPSGKHQLDVSRPGFVPYSRLIKANPSQTITVQVPLAPTPQYAGDRWAHAKRLRTIAYAAAGTGLLLGGVSLGLFVDDNACYREWEQTQARLDADWLRFSGTPQAPVVEQQQRANDALIDKILARDRVALGLAVGGGALLATGAVLYLIGEDPQRYERFLLRATASGWAAGYERAW